MSAKRTKIRKIALVSTVLALTVGGIGAGSMGPESYAIAQPRMAQNLESLCTPDAMQAVASTLSDGVTVRPIKISPFRTATRFVAASGNQSAYCQVTGSYVTNPATGKTANFLATFPESWNGKYLQLGCSSHCGQFFVSDPATPAITVTAQGYPGQIIEKGYATFATDEGHESYDPASWAIKADSSIDTDMMDDFLFRAQKVLTHMGKEFTTAIYAGVSGGEAKISRSYFNGCSGGGRDAMVAASHFPEEFDGIIAGSAYHIQGIPLHVSAVGVAMRRSPDAKLSPAHFALVSKTVTAQCDARDGVKDGVIQNPAACNFNPDRDLPRCKAGDDAGQCFSQGQIDTVSIALNAVTDEHGAIVQPGFSVSEFQSPEAIFGLMDSVHTVFVNKNDPAFALDSLYQFQRGGPGQVKGLHAVMKASDVERHRAALASGARLAPDQMDRLTKSGTKLLLWHNLSDELLTPYTTINWYMGFARHAGGYAKAREQARLFLLPGTTHCSISGVAPNSFDSIGALENWVEQGQAPNQLMANVAFRQFTPGAPKAPNMAHTDWTMPLCAFPQMARYSGKGDVRDGKNWSCPAGDKRMLKRGLSGINAGMAKK